MNPIGNRLVAKFEANSEITKADLGLWNNKIGNDIRAFVAKLKDNEGLTDQQKLKILNKYNAMQSEIEEKLDKKL